MKSPTFINFLILINLLITVDHSIAKETIKYKLQAPVEKLIIEEEQYSFTEQEYSPPYRLRLTADSKALTFNTPESALHAYFSSLANGDIDGRLNSMVISEKLAFNNLEPAKRANIISTLQKQAAVFLQSGAIELVKKYTVDSIHVVVDFVIHNADNKDFTWSAVIAFENGYWRVCTACGTQPSDPLYPILVNNNYKFIGRENTLTRNRLFTPTPTFPFYNIEK